MRGSHGTFYWNELMTRDVEGAKKFYAETLGWSFDGMPMPGGGTYWVAKMDGESVAGILDISTPEFAQVPECWMSYLAVDPVFYDLHLDQRFQELLERVHLLPR